MKGNATNTFLKENKINIQSQIKVMQMMGQSCCIYLHPFRVTFFLSFPGTAEQPVLNESSCDVILLSTYCKQD